MVSRGWKSFAEAAAVILTYFAYITRELWTLVPAAKSEADKITPFIFSDQKIYPQTYYWMLWLYVYFSINTMIILSLVSDRVKIFFWTVFALATLEVIEFKINYNDYWFWKVNITTARYFILFYVGSNLFRSWKKHNQLSQ